MISRISETIALKIKDANPEETASVAVMKFALISLLNNTITFFFILCIGAVSGHFIEICIVSASFMLLRLFAGGTHFESSSLCILVTTIILSAIPYIAKFVNSPLTLAFTLISLTIAALNAPTNVLKTRIKPAQYPIYKWISIFIISLNLFINSPLISIAFLIQTTSTIQIKGGK